MKPYQALIWNEWRQMRNNVMALAGVTVLPGLLMLLGCEDKTLAEYILVAVALIICMPILYSVVLGDSFAREFDQKTDCFLSELPITPTTIFFCKYCASLMIFLALSAVSSLIMALTISHAMNLNPGRGSINTLLLLFVLIPFWISAHATVFLTSLLSKQPGNGIAAIIIMPLLILLLLPGAMVITMFFINDNSLWIRYSVLLTPIILYGFCIGSGWYLWSYRIARGKKILKPFIAALSIMLILPWFLYGAAYLYFNLSYNLAVREAEAAGIDPVNTIRHVSRYDYFDCQVVHSTYYASLESTLCLPRYFQRAAEELRRKIRWISANTNIKTTKPEKTQ